MDTDLGWIASNEKEHTPETHLPQSLVQYFYHDDVMDEWVLDPDLKVGCGIFTGLISYFMVTS